MEYSKRRATLSRLTEITRRQIPYRYGSDYIPCFLAKRSEAPSKGRLYTIPAQGRVMHFMSAAEYGVACYVLYCKLEVMENRLMSPIEGRAVLDGHPLLRDVVLPHSTGTVELAKQLGIKHPFCIDDREKPVIMKTGRIREHFPLIDDQLVLLPCGRRVRRGVSLYIKKKRRDLILSGRNQEKFELWRAYYQEAEIPTVQISGEDLLSFPETENLMFLAHYYPAPQMPKDVLVRLIRFMQDNIFDSAPAAWAAHCCRTFRLTQELVFEAFHHAVFHRHLKVDLAKTVVYDRVHTPEKRDVGEEFKLRFLQPI